MYLRKSSRVTSYQFSFSSSPSIMMEEYQFSSDYSGSFLLQGWLLGPGISFSWAIVLDGSPVQFSQFSLIHGDLPQVHRQPSGSNISQGQKKRE